MTLSVGDITMQNNKSKPMSQADLLQIQLFSIRKRLAFSRIALKTAQQTILGMEANSGLSFPVTLREIADALALIDSTP